MENVKSLCAKISVPLHDKVSAEKEQSGLTLNQYIEQIITEYYKLKEGEKTMSDKNVRTLAIQVSAELMDKLDAYLEKNGIKKKAFLTSLIEKVLEDAQKEQLNDEN
ncbi:MAG: 4-oxalocrotonate tautomerase [Clostridia bacterium]